MNPERELIEYLSKNQNQTISQKGEIIKTLRADMKVIKSINKIKQSNIQKALGNVRTEDIKIIKPEEQEAIKELLTSPDTHKIMGSAVPFITPEREIGDIDIITKKRLQPRIETKRRRYTETEGQSDKQTNRQRDKETRRQRNREKTRQTSRQAGRQAGRQASRKINKQTNKQTHTHRQTDKETKRQRDKETKRQRDTQTNKHATS